MDTYFAPPGRTERRAFKSQIDNISHSPIMTALLKTASGLLVILNEDRQVVAVNHAFLDAIGIGNADEVLGLRLGEALRCVHACEPPNGCGTTQYCMTCGAAIAMMSAIVDDKMDERICSLTADRNGTAHDMSLLVQAQPIKADGFRWILIYAQDVTRQQFWNNMEHVFFHDINNILTSLRGISHLHFMDMPENENAKKIMEISERLCDEISLQSALAQHKNAGYVPRRSLSTFSDIRHHLDVIIRNHRALKDRGIREVWPEEDLSLNTDKMLVSRVLGNMIINALEATREGGSISLTTMIDEDHIVWEVWNDAFIEEDVQRRIFQRHFSTKSDFGRGLGTYSMRLFGEEYLKGRVAFRSSRGSGTTFTFSLPRH